MAVRCRDLLCLSSLRNVKLIGGEKGLDRIVRWVHVAEVLPDSHAVLDWLYGGELLFVTGSGMKENPSLLVELIQKSYDKKLAGLMVFVGPYIRQIPAAAIEYADKMEFPLFELPWEVRMVEVTQEICSAITMHQMRETSEQNLVENILFLDIKEPEEAINRAAFHGLDLRQPCCVMMVDIDDFSGYLKRKELQDEKRIMELKHNFNQWVVNVLYQYNKKCLSMQRSDSVIIILSLQGMNEKDVQMISERIRQNIADHANGLTVSIGVGNAYKDVSHMKKSMKEAEQALKTAKYLKESNNTFFYRQIGIFRLLLKVEDRQELQNFYQEQLGRIIEYDRLYNAQLLNTLTVYLHENANGVKAAQTMFLHRNTLKYRLQKIEEITGCNLQDTESQFEMRLALKIGQYLEFE